jgi:hypothetical protein
MTTLIFAGPSLYGVSGDISAAFTVRPPAECGDVTRAVRDGATAIGLIDGRFETTASVWHKELLWALSIGVRVFGSSSMGALRAAETWQFGMRGIGLIYRLYRSGALRDDDEVAILHGPPEVGSVPLTEAMVNIRLTLRRARRLGVISDVAEVAIARIAKSLYYKERTYNRIFGLCSERPDLRICAEALRSKLHFLHRDVKREDALILLSRMRGLLCDQLAAPTCTFSPTTFWTAFATKQIGVRATASPPLSTQPPQLLATATAEKYSPGLAEL